MKKVIISLFLTLLVAAAHVPVTMAQQPCSAAFQYSIGAVTPNGATISFYDSSFAVGTILSWNWQFSNGQVSTLQNPVIQVTAPSTMVACLTITAMYQNQSCTSTWCDTIVVNGNPPCNAAFTYSVTPSVVAFAAATGNNVSWQWSFGDGTSGSGTNVTHTYAAPGTYQVCLTVQDTNGTSCTSCQAVVVPGGTSCNAAFTAALIPGTTMFQFTNQSTGNATYYYWNFGDGTTSTLENPTHAYNGFGPYTVCLTITDSLQQCTDTYCDSLSVNQGGGCQAGFNVTVSPMSPVAVFTNISNAPAGTTYIWDFGDGTTSTQTSPVHTYSAPGTYTVCLTIINQNAQCFNTYCATVVISNSQSCQASWSWYPDSSGTGIQFVNTSTGNPTNYSWTFGNGTTSNQQNPFVTFNSPGWYLVCLSIWTVNGTCQSTSCDSVYFSGQGSGCSSNFAIYPDTLTPHNYFAINLASGVAPITYLWSWGDGTSGTGAYPSHTYAGPGLYTICLTITDGSGCTSTTCYQWQLLRLSGVSAPVTINVIAPGSTGVTDAAGFTGVNVFPSPATDWLTMEYNLEKVSDVTIRLINIAGQAVWSMPAVRNDAGHHEIKLDVNGFPSGMYLVEIVAEDFGVRRRVIIQ